MTLGQRLKSKRKENKLTQVDVASRLGIDNTTVSKWESDTYEPDVDTLRRLADLYNTTTDYLTGNTSNPSPSDKKDQQERSKDELLQELTTDPDDYFFLDGYLQASDEEKKELRRSFYEIKKQMRENNIKPTSPMSLRDFNQKIKKPD